MAIFLSRLYTYEPHKIVIHHRRAEQQTIEPIEHTAVARDELSRILSADLPLDERFG
jgi:hypothetical protein